MSEAALARAIDTIATLLERGAFAPAAREAQAHLARHPQHAEIWRLLGIAQLQTGERGAALASFERALTLVPDSVDVLCNLASVQAQSGNAENAQNLLQRALAFDPDHAAALHQLGRLRHDAGDYAGAARYFERCAQLHPDHPMAWLSLANTRAAQFDFPAAEAHARRALALDTRSPDAHYVLGFVSERQGRLEDARAAYRSSMQFSARPRTAYNLALVLDQLGDWLGAAQLLERALALDPNLIEAVSQLVFVKRRLCDWSGLAPLAARLQAAVAAQLRGPTPFSFLAEEATPALQLSCARAFARQFAQPSPARPARRLGQDDVRVGFVSSGFNQHATGLLVVELIERLRASNLTTLAFATTPDDGSDMRRRLVAGFHQFGDVSGFSPHAIAQTIREARCDLLIDIDGYCMGSIPQIFAARPAPIQINWLAYPGSLGAPWYDYLIADRFLIPGSQREHYDEKIAYLPRCYQPTDTTRAVATPPAREHCGLPSSAFVYCCFNATWKISPATFALWMRILHAVSGSVLWLLDGPSGNGVAERLRARAREAGIDPQRLVFGPKLGHADYLARFRHADLFLDTHPYNAHTTASDAIYAGCPVLTRPGDTFASRVAGSLNHRLGLNELNVADDDAYVALAVDFASQPSRLGALRARLGEPATRARLFDMQAYADDFAALLTRIFERARGDATPADISL